MDCPNLNLKFYKKLQSQFGKKTAYQWHNIIQTEKFINWFGFGKVDSEGMPNIDRFGNITNGKSQTYRVLGKSNFKNVKDLTNFLSSNYTEGIRLYKGSYYLAKTMDSREYGRATLEGLNKHYPGLITQIPISDNSLKADYTHRLEINKNYFNRPNTQEQFDIDVDALPDMPMQPTNLSRLEAGEKTISIRPKNLRDGLYSFNGKAYHVNNRGTWNVDEYLKFSNLTLEELIEKFTGDEEIKYEHIQDWLQGKGPDMYVYEIDNNITQFDADATDSTQDPRFTSEIKRLEILLAKLNFRKKSSSLSSEERASLELEISNLKVTLRNLKDEAKRSLELILDNAEDHITQVKNILSKEVNYFNILSSLELVLPYISLLNEFTDLSPAEEARIATIISAISKLEADAKKAMTSKANSIVRNIVGKEIVINGVSIPVKDDTTIGAYSLGSSNSTNAIAQTITKKIKDVENAVDSENRFFLEEHDRLVNELLEYQKAKGIKEEDAYKFMIQEDDEGKPTGLYVDELDGSYFSAYKAAKDKSLVDFLLFLGKEHTLSVNQEKFDSFKEGIKRWADTQTWVSPSNSKLTNEEHKLATIEKQINKANPQTLINIINKLKEGKTATYTELEWVKQFMKNKMFLVNKKAHNKWEDSKYDTIMQLDEDNPLKKFYNHFNTNIKKGRRELGEFFDDKYLFFNYIPEVSKNSSFFRDIGNKLTNSFTEFPNHSSVTDVDIITGQPMHQIPVWSLSGKMDPSQKSYNLGGVLKVFTAQKFNKIYKEQIQDDVNLLLAVLREQDMYETDSKGNIIEQMVGGKKMPVIKKNVQSNTYKAAQYLVDSNIYEQRQSKDGVLMTIYDKDTKEKLAGFVKLQKERGYSDADLAKDKYVGLTEPESNEYQTLEKQYKEVTGKKIANKLIYLTTLKGLALNPFSGISEFIQGLTAVFTEAAGNEFYSDSNARRALGLILHSTNPKINRKKIQQLMGAFGLNEAVHTEVETDSLLDKSFFFLKEANYRTRGLNMLAMLDAEIIKDKNGVEHKLLDVIDVEKGHVVLKGDFDEVFTIFDADGKPRLTAEFNKLQQKIAFMTKSLLSRDSSKDPILTNKTAIGRLLGQFRQSWMFEGINRRFGKEKDIPLLGRKTKGYYVSVFINKDGKVDFARALRLLWSYKFDKTTLELENLSDLDEANVRKVLREASIIAATLAAYAAATLALMGDDDDEEEEGLLYRYIFTYILNQSYRVNRDLTFYLNPDSAAELTKNIMPALKTVTDLKDIFDAFARTAFFDPYIYEGTKKERLRILKEFEEAFPFLNQPRRMFRKITESDKFLS